jgi:hypothetical protein
MQTAWAPPPFRGVADPKRDAAGGVPGGCPTRHPCALRYPGRSHRIRTPRRATAVLPINGIFPVNNPEPGCRAVARYRGSRLLGPRKRGRGPTGLGQKRPVIGGARAGPPFVIVARVICGRPVLAHSLRPAAPSCVRPVDLGTHCEDRGAGSYSCGGGETLTNKFLGCVRRSLGWGQAAPGVLDV